VRSLGGKTIIGTSKHISFQLALGQFFLLLLKFVFNQVKLVKSLSGTLLKFTQLVRFDGKVSLETFNFLLQVRDFGILIGVLGFEFSNFINLN